MPNNLANGFTFHETARFTFRERLGLSFPETAQLAKLEFSNKKKANLPGKSRSVSLELLLGRLKLYKSYIVKKLMYQNMRFPI